jgi:stearoyl-CoA desaturase (delta-9 desaturase)
VGWTFGHSLTNALQFSPDLLRDPLVRNISRRYALWVALGVVIPALIGGVVGRGILGVWHGLVWGVGVRLFLSYHLTSSINSITHMYGYRRFDTPDCSRNNLWLGWITFGEGWHNNHHAAPASAHFGRAWWEVDPGSLLIRALRRCSLASDVRAQPGLRGRLHRALAP